MQDPTKARRTYFTKPLVDESLECLPAALQFPDVPGFKRYVVEHVPQNSLKSRQRIARDLAQRFSSGGQMNLTLAAAIKRFGDSKAGREILYFELLRSMPLLEEIATLWVAPLPAEGAARSSLAAFLESRMPGRSVEKVTKDSMTTLKQCGKVRRPKVGWIQANWVVPPIEAFLYVLGRLFPERSMERVDLFASLPILRGMLWPQPGVEDLLRQAEQAGHISKITQLDQYYQFTLSAPGPERLSRLMPEEMAAAGKASAFELRPEGAP